MDEEEAREELMEPNSHPPTPYVTTTTPTRTPPYIQPLTPTPIPQFNPLYYPAYDRHARRVGLEYVTHAHQPPPPARPGTHDHYREHTHHYPTPPPDAPYVAALDFRVRTDLSVLEDTEPTAGRFRVENWDPDAPLSSRAQGGSASPRAQKKSKPSSAKHGQNVAPRVHVSQLKNVPVMRRAELQELEGPMAEWYAQLRRERVAQSAVYYS